MRIKLTRENALVIEAGRDSHEDERITRLSALALIAVVLLVTFIRAGSLFQAVGLLIFMSPCLLVLFLLVMPSERVSDRIVIDLQQDNVVMYAQHYSSTSTKVRTRKDFAAILILEDQVQHGTLGIGPRFRLFFRIGQKTVRPRILYIDDVLSAEEAARAAKQICEYTGWPIEFLTLDRPVQDSDVEWESW